MSTTYNTNPFQTSLMYSNADTGISFRWRMKHKQWDSFFSFIFWVSFQTFYDHLYFHFELLYSVAAKSLRGVSNECFMLLNASWQDG